MADLAITAANVTTSSTSITTGTAGAAVTAGQAVYQNSDGKYYLAQCDGTSAEATVFGIALCNAAAGQPLTVQTGGDITIGATVAKGTTYVVSANAGGIAPQADLVSTNYLSYIGYGKTTSVLTINKTNTGVTL